MQSRSPKYDSLEAYEKASAELTKLYSSEQGKKFVHHLITSFLTEKVVYLLYSGSEIKDCLTHSRLNTLFNRTHPLTDPEILELLSKINADSTVDEKYDIYEKVQDDLEAKGYKMNFPRLAIRTRHSTKTLGSEELQALKDFSSAQVESGNKLIEGILKYQSYEVSQDSLDALKSKFESK